MNLSSRNLARWTHKLAVPSKLCYNFFVAIDNMTSENIQKGMIKMKKSGFNQYQLNRRATIL